MSNNSKQMVIKNARVSFPDLFIRPIREGKEGKYGVTVLLHKEKDKETLTTINEIINNLIKESGFNVANHKRCLWDGNDPSELGADPRPEYAGYVYFRANKRDRRPQVFDRDKSPLTRQDEKIYPGCYCNISLNFWVQNNEHGKRVNANLAGVQFVKDGESFLNGMIDESF